MKINYSVTFKRFAVSYSWSKNTLLWWEYLRKTSQQNRKGTRRNVRTSDNVICWWSQNLSAPLQGCTMLLFRDYNHPLPPPPPNPMKVVTPFGKDVCYYCCVHYCISIIIIIYNTLLFYNAWEKLSISALFLVRHIKKFPQNRFFCNKGQEVESDDLLTSGSCKRIMRGLSKKDLRVSMV